MDGTRRQKRKTKFSRVCVCICKTSIPVWHLCVCVLVHSWSKQLTFSRWCISRVMFTMWFPGQVREATVNHLNIGTDVLSWDLPSNSTMPRHCLMVDVTFWHHAINIIISRLKNADLNRKAIVEASNVFTPESTKCWTERETYWSTGRWNWIQS